MTFLADLHIHSRFSRATSKALTARHLASWAVCKGLNVLGTGDFTHPVWREELREQLELDESCGLYRLRVTPEPLPLLVEGNIAPERLPFFIPQTEISSIYKRHGKVRKVHNLVFVPTLEDADRLSAALAKIGNLNADGRPILGLDSHDLLELVLETVPDGVLIPAHIWTPWFSLFGSRSGFDSMEECFGDLAEHIFALETGLSSDPAMNRLVSQLDKYVLISNSDAHSGANLAREANAFEGVPSYHGIFTALRTAARRETQDKLVCRFRGTLEFFPEEGKYHLDGHRNCGVCLSPEESVALHDICPVCGKPLTVGVLHRVMALADRTVAPDLEAEPEPQSLIPLPEIIGELLGVGAGSQKVAKRYAQLLHNLGPELNILCSLPLQDIAGEWDELGEAVARLRRGDVIRNSGYDGEFGVIRLFAEGELAHGRHTLLPMTGQTQTATWAKSNDCADTYAQTRAKTRTKKATKGTTAPSIASLPLFAQAVERNTIAEKLADVGQENLAHASLAGPNAPGEARIGGIVYSDEQKAALEDGPGPILVLAGPGAGKTRLLVGRIVNLLQKGVAAQDILSLTFTQRAAREMQQRLALALPGVSPLPQCLTMHAYAFGLLRAVQPEVMLLTDQQAQLLFAEANPQLPKGELASTFTQAQLAVERLVPVHAPDLAECLRKYRTLKKQYNGKTCFDFCDLLLWLNDHATNLPQRPAPVLHLLVDEIQDLTPLQYALVRKLLPANGHGFFGIGDPDQSIYAFRGSEGLAPEQLSRQWPDLRVHRLRQSYRAAQAVLDVSHNLLGTASQCGHLVAHHTRETELHLFTAPSAQAEQDWIATRVAQLLGTSSHTLHDARRKATVQASVLDNTLTPGDIAVLVRLKAQIPPIAKALAAVGVPTFAPQNNLFWKDETCRALLALCGDNLRLPVLTCVWDAPLDRQAALHAGLPQQWKSALPSPADMKTWLMEQPWAGPLFCRSEAYAQMCRFWQQQESWEHFFDALALVQEGDLLQEKAEGVQLLTMHAAKGLEFGAVFLPGLEDGLMPLNRAVLFGPGRDQSCDKPVDLAEERRLLYVALTRASQGIFASYASSRTLYGRELRLAPSPFLPQIRDYCRQSTLVRHASTSMRQGSLL